MKLNQKRIYKIVSGIILAFFVLGWFQFLIIPQKVQAQVLPSTALTSALGTLQTGAEVTGVSSNIVGNRFDLIKIAIENVARGAASAIVDAIMNRFVNKLLQKYQIGNYLYYDQVLTNYYLSNYISDKIQDPDLRNIYGLLNAGYVTGAPTGTTGGPPPSSALIPKLKTAINKYYQDNYGVPENVVTSNPGNLNGFDYYSALFAYSINNPGYVQQNLQGQFGAFQSSATTAAQLEVIVGNSLKAGRVIGGFCTTPGDTTNTSWGDSWSPASCTAAGGVWNASALDQARSFISNPTAMTEKYLQSALNSIFTTDWDPTNFWYVIGKSLGSFIFNQLSLDQGNGVLVDNPAKPYVPDNGGKGIDIDGDGTVDGYDINNDGIIDVCIYGGTAPNCIGSKTALIPPTNPTPTPTPTPSPNPPPVCVTTSSGTTGDGPAFDLNSATILNSPSDIASWAETAQITNVNLSGNVSVDFTKKDGTDRWPDQPFGTGSLEYTIWLFLHINGQWYGSGFIEMWNGRPDTGDSITDAPCNWYYDAGRWAPMTGHMIIPGEQIGIMVSAGDARNNATSTVHERSNVMLVTVP